MSNRRAPNSKLKNLNANVNAPHVDASKRLLGSIEISDEDGPVGELSYVVTEDRDLRIVYTSYEGVPPLRGFTAWERRDG